MSEASARYGLDDLLRLMAVLRDSEQGCPWDVKQDWDSIVPHTLEEAYEVADAIERRAFDELPGELGDLLFQVVYYSQFAREEGRFDFHDVVDVLTAKMVARHPHVFPDGTLESRRPVGVPADEVETAGVKTRWEALKAQERENRQAVSVLDDVPRTLPALSRGAKLSKRAARIGFDWPDARGVFDKIREELAEVEEAADHQDADHVREEIGDLLFAVTNLARRFDVDPERALREANGKFERRFRHVESALAENALAESALAERGGGRQKAATLDEMERHWQAAKQREASES